MDNTAVRLHEKLTLKSGFYRNCRDRIWSDPLFKEVYARFPTALFKSLSYQ